MSKTLKSETSTLFVSDFPQEVEEDTIRNFFKDYVITNVYFVRKPNKCYCQVIFDTYESSENARINLNLKPISFKNKLYPLRICKYEKPSASSNDKNNILIKNLPKDMSARELYELLTPFGDIKSCKLEIDLDGKSMEYGYVTFYESDSTLKAIDQLNSKKINGKPLELVSLSPNIGKDNKNVIYVKHLPSNFDENNFKKIFNKYGDVSHVKLTKDNTGKNTGTGFVTFLDHRSAAAAIADVKLKPISFPSLPPLYVAYLQKKEERNKQNVLENSNMHTKLAYGKKFAPVTLFAKLIDESLINELDSFISNICLFIKIVMVSEYSPLQIEPNMERKSAFVVFKTSKDAEKFMLNYRTKMINPEFYFDYIPENPSIINTQIPNQVSSKQYQAPINNKYNVNNSQNVIGLTNSMNSMSINTTKQPVYQQVKMVKKYDSLNEEELANEIYETASISYPNQAHKIAGMIVDLGQSQMRELLNDMPKLIELINQAYKVSSLIYYYKIS